VGLQIEERRSSLLLEEYCRPETSGCLEQVQAAGLPTAIVRDMLSCELLPCCVAEGQRQNGNVSDCFGGTEGVRGRHRVVCLPDKARYKYVWQWIASVAARRSWGSANSGQFAAQHETQRKRKEHTEGAAARGANTGHT